MGILDPIPPPYDPLEWAQLPFDEKARQVCRAWALEGYGTPLPAYVFYGLKIAFYVGMWLFFCRFSPEVGQLSEIGSWWLEPIAFQKAIVWSLLFEVLGLGLVPGWNFGDGHLHDERLLAAVQQQCDFEDGELQCIFVESQPLGRSHLHWRIADAHRGPLEQGTVDVQRLLQLQPWPEPDSEQPSTA